MQKGEESKKRWYKFYAIFFWLVIWQLLSLWMDHSVLLPSPVDTVLALFRLIQTQVFWKSSLFTLGRIVLGFLSAAITGAFLAVLSYRFRLCRELIHPFITLVKAIPVASFIILALLWIGAAKLPVLVSFLIVLPVFYNNVFQGIESLDHKLLEMANVFRISRWKRVRFLYVPAVRPYFLAASSIGFGLCWKSGVAAEVIGLSANSIGRQLYDAKLYLMTEDVFAWTAIIVLMSIVFEKLMIMLIRKIIEKGSKIMQ